MKIIIPKNNEMRDAVLSSQNHEQKLHRIRSTETVIRL